MPLFAKPDFSDLRLLKRTPLTEVIAEQLQSYIVGGVFKPGERLPTQEVLSKTFGVSRNTLRLAISIVADNGLIEKRQGSSAIFVKVSKPLLKG
jgi:GntR family transcriptional repressor for pyruvate dehydrogenase complex